ncbi:MAG: carboxyl transferase [Clostridiales bacterium]|nr:carboxyl transferase [Clostridiales bacterium]
MNESKQMSARERIENLLDDNSFVEIGAKVSARATDFNMAGKETPADGVVTGYGVIDGRVVYIYSQDIKVLNGAVGEMHGRKISRIYDLAIKTGSPVIGMIDCAGMRLQEATDALDAFGELYLKQVQASGVIPQITAVFGTCGGGAALIPALSDFTLMTKKTAKLFVNSPNALDGNEISRCDTSDAVYQAEAGLADVLGEDDSEVIAKIRALLAFLPSNNTDIIYDECQDDLNRENPAVADMKDTAVLLKDIADNYNFYEVKSMYGKEMVTGFIKLDGMTVGAVANRSEILDDEGEVKAKLEPVLTTAGARKAAGFVKFCDAFGIPVLTLVNVKGYKATKHEERTIAKAAADMTAAYAQATVPKVSVVIGEAFGSAYLTMCSKHIGADIVYAYPDAKIGMMNAESAVKIIYADEIAASDNAGELIAEKAAAYDELQTSPLSAAGRGYIDDVIEPAATRKRVLAAFEMLCDKDMDRVAVKKHTTI